MSHTLRLAASVLLLTFVMTACGAKLPPAVVGPPHYPEFIFPALVASDPRLAELSGMHQSGWQALQAGDADAAERTFQAVLKKSAAFYPSDTALGYVALARSKYPEALTHFERVLKDRPDYVPALVGRGQTMLSLSRDEDALASFEAALRVDSSLPDLSRRVEVLRARAAQDNVAAARSAAQAGRLDEAIQAYEKAIAASPQSGFLFRDLADIEVKQGKTTRRWSTTARPSSSIRRTCRRACMWRKCSTPKAMWKAPWRCIRRPSGSSLPGTSSVASPCWRSARRI
jgi:Tfp pilus assembly protein PilF